MQKGTMAVLEDCEGTIRFVAIIQLNYSLYCELL